MIIKQCKQRLKYSILLAILIFCFSQPLAITAQEEIPLELNTETSLMKGEITEKALIYQVSHYHPLILKADLERRLAAAKHLEKQGAFDPQLSFDSVYLRYNDFINRGKPSKTWDNLIELNVPTRSGLELLIGAQHNTGDVKPPLYPTGDGGEYFMGLKIPVLRGFRLNKNAVEEMKAEIGIPVADAMFTKIRLDVTLEALNNYWDWIISYKKIMVNQELLELSTFRKEAIAERVKNGDLPRIDLVEANQEVLLRKGNLIKSKREYEKQLFQFSRYLWQADGNPYSYPTNDHIPAKILDLNPYTQAELAKGIESALQHRPEIKALNLKKEILDVDLNYAKNQKLPNLNLYAFPGADTGGESVGLTLKAGVQLIIPLRQRTAKGLIKIAEYKTQQLDLEQRLILQTILIEIEDAFSAINAQYDQFTTAKEEYDLALKLEDGEKLRFQFGDTDLFLVNQRERQRAATAIKLLDLQAQYFKAVAKFNTVTLQLLP